MREDNGEIETAEQGELPRVIELTDIRGDLHTHTDWSDGRFTMEEMATAAQAAGREYIAVTDHSPSATIANGLGEDRLLAHNTAVRELDARLGGITLLAGTEMDILSDGTLDYPDDLLADLDVVLGSVHSAMAQDSATMTERVVKAMRNPHLDIVAHLTTRIIGRRAPTDVDVGAVFEAAVETGTVLEINASPQRLDLKDAHIKWARQLGVIFAINTDAHRTPHFDSMKYGVATARRGWCETWRVINTLGVDRLREFLSTPKGERYALMRDHV